MRKRNVSETTRQKNRDRATILKRSRIAAGLCDSCGKNPPAQGIRSCQDCADKHNQHYQEKSIQDKLAAFGAYGGAFCACCGEDIVEFLTMDHVNSDGAEHRKQSKSPVIVRWLKRNNYPPGFQVLCSNCQNRWKFPDKICPHKRQFVEKTQLCLPGF